MSLIKKKITMNKIPLRVSRRDVLSTTSCGFGYLALKGLLGSEARAEGFRSPLSERASHFPARAKRVIFMFMQGGPSHLETFDYKPELIKSGGKKTGGKGLLAPRYSFQKNDL